MTNKKSSCKMEQSTPGNGVLRKEKVTEHRFGWTAQSMKATGKMIRQMDEEYSITQMEIYMMENGEMTRLMEKVCILMLMEQLTMDIGLRISKTGMELKHGQMERNTKGSIKKERSMEKAN